MFLLDQENYTAILNNRQKYEQLFIDDSGNQGKTLKREKNTLKK